MEVKSKRLGGLFDGDVKHQAGSVWDKNYLCPALDTAQGGEDNLTSSLQIIQLGGIANQITSTRNNPQRYRVYDIRGLAPALNCAQGGGLNPYIIVKV